MSNRFENEETFGHSPSVMTAAALALAALGANSLGAWADIWSTHQALGGGGSEANVFVTDESGGISDRSFWIANHAINLLFAGGMFWAARNLRHVPESYVRNPLRSLGDSMHPGVALLPFLGRFRGRAAMMYFAAGFYPALIRVVVVPSNLRVAGGEAGVIDPVFALLAPYLDGAWLYLASISVLLVPLWGVALLLAGIVMKALRGGTAEAHHALV